MVVGARQNFRFFRENTWFLENNRTLSKVRCGILHYLISIIKLLKKKTVYKTQFFIRHVSHLNQAKWAKVAVFCKRHKLKLSSTEVKRLINYKLNLCFNILLQQPSMWLLLTYEELPRSLFYRRFFEEWAIP